MTQITNFGMIGRDFEIKLISQIVYDRKFGNTIVPLLSTQYFNEQSCRYIINIIKNHNQKYPNQIPTKNGLVNLISADGNIDDINKKMITEVLKQLESKSFEDREITQEMSLNFCKQQEVLNAFQKVSKIISNGDFENYDTISNIMQKALNKGARDDNSIEIDFDIDVVLEEKYRNPIPTGVDGLDMVIGGGLGESEFGMLIIPTGVGKTTLLSKIANTAFLHGKNVLQIIFEDKENDIQRKHYSALTNIPLSSLHLHKDKVKQELEKAKLKGGRLFIKKYPSDSTSVSHIKQQLNIYKNKGIKIDMLIVDYVDCLTAHKDDELQGEGVVIRQLESLCDEEKLALWTAVQSNRQGANSSEVDVSMVQGSFKRVQVGHLVISVGKTQEQKKLGLATMSILKSRFGGDGEIFKNMIFRNDTMVFDTTEQSIVDSELFTSPNLSGMNGNTQNSVIKVMSAIDQIQQKKNNFKQNGL